MFIIVDTSALGGLRVTKADEKKLDSFRNWLYDRGFQHGTVNTYVINVRRYLEFMRNKRLSDESAKEYVDYLSSNCTNAVAKMCVFSANKYLEYTGRNRRLKYIEPPIVNKSKPLTVVEYRRLLAAAKDENPLRLYYIIETLCASGLAISKFKYLTVEAIEAGVVNYEDSRGDCSCCLPSKLCAHLKEYAQKAGIRQGMIFVDDSGEPLIRNAILSEIQQLSVVARVDESKITFDNFIGLYEYTRECMEREIVDKIDLLRGYYETNENSEQTG